MINTYLSVPEPKADRQSRFAPIVGLLADPYQQKLSTVFVDNHVEDRSKRPLGACLYSASLRLCPF